MVEFRFILYASITWFRLNGQERYGSNLSRTSSSPREHMQLP